MGIKIVETAFYLPENVRANEFYEKKFKLPPTWIEQRTGIVTRHIADKNVFSSDLACSALRNLNGLSDAQFLICVSSTPDSLLPSNANRIAEKLKIKDILCFDLMAGCSSFLYGFVVANSLLESGLYKTGMIVACEKADMIIDQEDKVTSPLFGDSAAVWLVESNVSDNLKSIYLGSDSNGVKDLFIPTSNDNLSTAKVKMNGKNVFRNAVNKIVDSILISLDNAKMDIKDIDYLIPHQANKRIIEQVQMRVGIPLEKVLLSIDKLGNSISSSIPITFHLNKEKLINKNIMIASFGAGYNYGSLILKVE